MAAAEPWPNTSGFDTNYEELEPIELDVSGSIPYYIAGALYRTGPLGYKVKTDSGKRVIDFPDANGPPKVQYRSRRNVDEYLEIVRTTGRLDGFTFAAKRDPCESFSKKVMGMFVSHPNPNNIGVTISLDMPGTSEKGLGDTNPNSHSNGIETMHVKTDACFFKKIDPETLEPLGIAEQKQLHQELIGEFSAAHAKSDPVTGDVYNFNLKIGYPGTYRIFCTSASTGETSILATFTGTPAYIHSLFLSENYVILCVWNSYVAWGGLPLLYHRNVLDAIAPFDPYFKAKWYVVDRKHGKGVVATYESDAFYAFHTINAWEEPNSTDATRTDIIAELSMYENTDVMHRFHYDNLISSVANPDFQGKKRLSSLPMQGQFRLANVESAAGSSAPLPAELVFQADKFMSMELPTINPKYLTRRHRFTYGCADRLKSSFMDGVVKFDNTTQKSIFWEVEGHTPGEAIFVADPEGTAEDDGVLLTVVLDGYAERSYMLVLDAKDLKELGRAEMKGPMSIGFHGAYKGIGTKYGGDV